jgi:uncharacterized membrane protein YeaQ/YmgE (transglycosylase-associated protein family)
MTILGWLLFGLIVGLVGKFLMPGKDPGGIMGTTAIGMAGAVIGGYCGRQSGLYEEADPVGFVLAVFGAVLFLMVFRWIKT